MSRRRDGTIRLGTRGSALARAQTEQVAELLRTAHPHLEPLITIIRTTGDVHADLPLQQVGTKGMFVTEIEQALLRGEIDLGVHSLKDMPADLAAGLVIACTPEREDPRDAIVSQSGHGLDTLPAGARIGTGSPRRAAQIGAVRPDLRIEPIRGNIDTRMRLLAEGRYDAIVLACAGLNRLALSAAAAVPLEPAVCVPAVGQGALALEARRADAEVLELAAALNSAETTDCVAAERAFLAELNGGCTVPAGAYARVDGDTVILLAALADGAARVRRFSDRSHRTEAVTLGRRAARRLLDPEAS